jgi:hypothetical protein
MEKAWTYRDVLALGLILPRKARYTITDYNKLRKQGHSVKAARFICICSAVYHNTEWANSLNSLEKLEIKAYMEG